MLSNSGLKLFKRPHWTHYLFFFTFGLTFVTECHNDPDNCSKPLTYAIACADNGPNKMHNYIGLEPSGRFFNELCLDYKSKWSFCPSRLGCFVAPVSFTVLSAALSFWHYFTLHRDTKSMIFTYSPHRRKFKFLEDLSNLLKSNRLLFSYEIKLLIHNFTFQNMILIWRVVNPLLMYSKTSEWDGKFLRSTVWSWLCLFYARKQ